MVDHWYGRRFELDPNALQLRLSVDVPRHRSRPLSVRLFQVPSAEQRHDSPLWQWIDGWVVDPPWGGQPLTHDRAMELLCEATLQRRLPGIG